MKTWKITGGWMLGALLLTACTNTLVYNSSKQNPNIARPQTVAVLPVEVDYAGPLPDRATKEDLHAMDIGESRMYQRNLYTLLLRQTSKDLKLQIQPTERTNSILQDHHISVTDSWKMDPQQLAEVLGVDAVIKTAVSENRYLEELPVRGNPYAFGSPYGYRMGNGPWGYNPWGYAPGLSLKAADIQATTAVFDRKTGELLWRMTTQASVSLTNTSEAQVQQLMKKVARQLPYN